ncbi:MAG: chemotaxis protein CheA [Syntrophomonadaceae bacterium]|nr:chemotaxis protein CheA [Syntrophomonadaceae bacterium]
MDMSQYLDVFFEECKEHFQILSKGLLVLEKDPRDLSSINEIFRAAHTLKGMSATMGFDNMADLTHHMEDVLSKLKEGLLMAEAKIIDVLFDCFDKLQMMADSIQDGRPNEVSNVDLIERLEYIIGGEWPEDSAIISEESDQNGNQEQKHSSEEQFFDIADDEMPFDLNEYEMTIIKEVHAKNLNAYFISIRIAENCLMKSVRVFMVFKALEADGEILKTQPSVEELDEGKFENGFHIILVNGLDIDTIRQRIDNISEIKVDIIQPISGKAWSYSSPPIKQEKQNGTLINQVDEVIKTHKVKQTVRVDIEKLDILLNLVGELVINKGRLEQIGSTQEHNDLNDVVEQIERITNDLQNIVMKVRMVPIENVFNRFPRMVRDLAKDEGKDIEFIIEGKETELDRTVIDEIGDPLVHLLRNAVDHGIEDAHIRKTAGKPLTGVVRLIARYQGNNVFIEVIDDGGGLDVESIKNTAIEKGEITAQAASELNSDEIQQFVFRSGFSTAKNVTDVSGRGVGLDVVKSKIESLNGEIHVQTKPGEGTTFRIRLPLTLAILQALLVQVDPDTYAIPLFSVDETTMITENEIKTIHSQEVIVLRGTVLPLVRARALLDVPPADHVSEAMYVVVVRKGEKQVGMVVDSMVGQQEVVIKSLGKLMDGIPGFAGATILGDGGVSLILDVGTLF